MSFIIGEEIKKRVKRKGLKNKVFADAMNMEERNLYHFFKKEQVDMDLLLLASEVLDFDFVKLYIQNSKFNKYKSFDDNILKDESTKYSKPPSKLDSQISFSIQLQGSIEVISSEMSNLLHVIKIEAEQRGMHLV